MKLQKFLPLIGIVIFLCILWSMDLQKVWASIQNINFAILFLAILVTVPVVLLKSLKWNILARSCNINQSFSKSVSGWLVGFSIGIITPGRIGDLSRACYLKGRAGLGTGLTTVVVDRLIDVIVLFILTIAGLAFLITSYTIGGLLLPIAVLFIALLAIALAFTRRGLVASILRPIFRMLVPERYKPKLSSFFTDFYEGISTMGRRKSMVLLSTFVCIVAWCFSMLQYYALSVSLGLGLSFSFIFMVSPLTILLDSLPISFSGLGTRDAAFIYLLGLAGVAAESALALSIMILIVGYIVTGLVGMIFWMRNPIRTGEPQANAL